MTGYQSKRAMAQAIDKVNWADHEPDGRMAVALDDDQLTIAYQSGYYDGKKAAIAGRERNFCERCGKRTNDIHTCTPPQRTWVYLTDEHIKEIVGPWGDTPIKGYTRKLVDRIEAKSKELNA